MTDLSAGYGALTNFARGYQQREAGVEQAEQQQIQALKGPRAEAQKALSQPRPEMPETPELPQAPKPNFSEGAQQWVAVAAILSGLAGAVTRRHMTNALTAFSGAIQGFRQGKIEQYDQNYKTWKAETDKAIAETDSLYRKYKAILDDRKMNIDEKMANLQLAATAEQDNVAAQSAKLKRYTDFAVTMQTMQDNMIRMKELTARVQEAHDSLNERTLAATGMTYDDYVKARKDFDKLPAPQGETPAQRNQRFQEWSGVAGVGGAVISDDDARVAGAALGLHGDTSQIQNYSRGRAGPQNLVKIRHFAYEAVREEYGDDPKKLGAAIARIDAEYQGIRSGERALGTLAARVGQGAEEIIDLAPPLLAVSKRIDRTRFPTLNSLQLAADRGTGGEDVIELISRVNGVKNAYQQVARRGGVPSDESARRADEVLDYAWSSGQLERGINTLIDEAQRVLKATKRTGEDVFGSGTGLSAPQSGSSGTGSFIEGQIYTDAQGNRAKYQNGQWVPQ